MNLKKKTLEQRIKDLEYFVYRKYIEVCPRCKANAMNEWQTGICRICAYKKGDPI